MAAERGVSLVELLGGVLVLGLIVTVVTRVYGADSTAVEMASLTKLRYLHRATQLYQAQWAGELPAQQYVYSTWMGYSQSYFVSPCLPASAGNRVSYLYTWRPERRYALEAMGECAPLFIDLDCNPATAYANGEKSVGLAVLLNGSTIRKYNAGDPRALKWWTNR